MRILAVYSLRFSRSWTLDLLPKIFKSMITLSRTDITDTSSKKLEEILALKRTINNIDYPESGSSTKHARQNHAINSANAANAANNAVDHYARGTNTEDGKDEHPSLYEDTEGGEDEETSFVREMS